jgi:hypothetical protein
VSQNRKLSNYYFIDYCIKYVIVYDFPTTDTGAEAEFLYQISRAGQTKGNVGIVDLLYSEKDLARAKELIVIMNELKQVCLVMERKSYKIVVITHPKSSVHF